MKRIILIFSLMLTVFSGFAQVGIGTKTPDPSAMLEVKATNKGILIPRITLAQRNSIKSPANSLMIYQTDNTPGYYYYASGSWTRIANGNSVGGATNTFTAPLNLNGTTVSIPQANSTTNGFLSSTDWNKFNNVSNGTNQGDMLYWNGTSWVKLPVGVDEQSLVLCNGIPTWGGCPAALTTTAASAITASTATVGGEITKTGGTAITDRGVVWGTATNPTINLPTKQSFGSGSGTFSGTISGLEKLTTYYLRSYATNSAGTVYGNETSFTTLDVDITTGLVAFYPFNGNANDESGNGNNGTVYGATLATDRFGKGNSAYNFDGNSQYISVVSNNLPKNDRTISAWINIPNSTYIGMLMGYGGDGNCGTSYFIGINHRGTNQLMVSGHCANNETQADYFPPSNQWVNVICISSTSGTKIFVNGILVGSSTAFFTNTIGSNLFIGSSIDFSGTNPYEDSNGLRWLGKIDDFRIYNRALTESEITYIATH
jgi:hypothetical protein